MQNVIKTVNLRKLYATEEVETTALDGIQIEIKKGEEDKYHAGLFGFQVSAGSSNENAAQQLLQYNTKENALSLVKKINSIQSYFVEQTRLGIPIIAFDEALHGLVRDGATVFPQSIGLAATWNTHLMEKVSTAIAKEAEIRGIRQVLSPVINIATDVRWGRTEETYGEDPFLTAMIGTEFVKGLQGNNPIYLKSLIKVMLTNIIE